MYPTKVIVVAVYFISYIFFVTLLTAVAIDVSKIILKYKICGCNHKTSKMVLLIYQVFFFVYLSSSVFCHYVSVLVFTSLQPSISYHNYSKHFSFTASHGCYICYQLDAEKEVHEHR